MTLPTITYGVGHQEDCGSTTGWDYFGVTGLAGGEYSLVADVNDIFKLTADCDGAEDENFHVKLTAPLAGTVSTTTYNNFLLHWYTSAVGADGCGARVWLDYSGGGGEWLLGETVPQFSSKWHVTSGTLTTGNALTNIRFYCDDYTDAYASTGYVYYDFLMLFKGTFTLPYYDNIRIRHSKKIAQIPIPGRSFDIIQDLGLASSEITITGTMQAGETWGSADFPYGEYFYHMVREKKWQWLTLDGGNYKVFPLEFNFDQDAASNAQRTFELRFLTTSLSDVGDNQWNDRAWYGKE